jgi:peptidoglycan/xylan/chitin deacetylase (PgdA/CDA1 family)
LRWELLESKKIIEDISGNPVYAFAYPYNRASENEAKLVESCGYLIARRGGRMLNKSGENYFLINSIGVENNCSVKELQKKILKAEFKTILNPQ